jgi:phosphonoacetate hydrolase
MLSKGQRCVIGMLDGFGISYLEGTELPVIKNKLIKKGLFKKVSGCYPSVTNVNNVGIATGSWPVDHGIIANSYFNRKNGNPEYMNDKNLIKVDSVFIEGKKRNKKVAILSSKKKSTELFGDSVDIAITAENPPKDLVEAIGEPAHIYSSEVNDWLWQAAIYLLKNDKSIDLIYVHITDYPMHRWAPEEIGCKTWRDN